MLQVSTARIPHRILYVNNMPASRDKDAQSAANTQIMTITVNYVRCRQRITLNVLYTVWGLVAVNEMARMLSKNNVTTYTQYL